MSTIQIKNLSFAYTDAQSPVFENVNLNIDTSWRLGLIGRNGRGKTTFLNLLRGKLKGGGTIVAQGRFEYFPVEVQLAQQTALAVARKAIAPFDEWENRMALLAQDASHAAMEEYGEVEEAYAAADGYVINESIAAELGKLGVHASVLSAPFSVLSGGERVKLLLAAVFLKKHAFLLIDEPTDHLDTEGRQIVAKWLATKSGFILVSHDRVFLDQAIDHILSINRADVELQKGNYSSWRHNRTLQDEFEKMENRKLEASIGRLKTAAERTERWSNNVEKSKHANAKDQSKGIGMIDRGYVGHQAAKMMQRSKAIEKRRGREVLQKQSLLKNIEEAEPLILHTLKADKTRLVTGEGLALSFGERELFNELNFHINAGERVAVSGANGSGKSCLLKLVLGKIAPTKGAIRLASGLVISTLPQDTDFLKGTLREFSTRQGLEDKLFLALLRKLDFEREAFIQNMESYSAGQKKKVCLAASLAKPAHLFVWDEALNYIDVLSREQIEKAVLESKPTLLFVEHDTAFLQNVATRFIEL